MVTRSSNTFIVIASAIAIAFLIGILVLTLGRVTNLQNVLPKPQAAGNCENACGLSRATCVQDCRNQYPNSDDRTDRCLAQCDSVKATCVAACATTCDASLKDAVLAGCESSGVECKNGQWACKSTPVTCWVLVNNQCKQSNVRDDCRAAGYSNLNDCQKKIVGGVVNPTPTVVPTKTDGGGGGPKITPVITIVTPTANNACFNECYAKTGNGSGCTYVCNNKLSCWNGCKTNGKACLTSCISGAAITPTIAPSEGWIKIEDDDSRFSYNKSQSSNPGIFGLDLWAKNFSDRDYVYRGGTAHQSPAANTPNDFSGVATLNLTNGSLKFDKIRVGYVTNTNRGIADVYVDGNLLKSVDMRKGSITSGQWVSDVLTCGAHKIEIKVTDKESDHKNFITLDYVDIHECGETPPVVDDVVCQGNTNAPAQCFACNTDNQINILDFGCFSGKYGQNVGK